VFEEFKQVGMADKKFEGTGFGPVTQIYRAARRQDLGQEPDRRGIYGHLHGAGAA
jgi:hypothetical protein